MARRGGYAARSKRGAGTTGRDAVAS